jgi:hypothetical protein
MSPGKTWFVEMAPRTVMMLASLVIAEATDAFVQYWKWQFT